MAAGRSNLVGNFSHSQANSDYLESLRFFSSSFSFMYPIFILSIVKPLSVKMTRDPSQQFSFKFLQLSIRFFFCLIVFWIIYSLLFCWNGKKQMMMMKTTGSNGPPQKKWKDAYTLFNLCVLWLLCVLYTTWPGCICVSWPCQASEFDYIQQQAKESSWIFNSLSSSKKRTSISVIYDSENVQRFFSFSFLLSSNSTPVALFPIRGINQNTIHFITFCYFCFFLLLRYIIMYEMR
jgi:hypothetical protein